MTDRGVIAVDRGVFGHPRFADEPFTEREAWIWLIGEAAFKPHKRRVGPVMLNLRRGQIAHSLRFMAKEWKWSVGKVRRFLKMLATDYGPEDEALIDATIDTGITVVSIRKYNGYQRAIRFDDTPPWRGPNTATDTANGTPQQQLNLYPVSQICDDEPETDTPTDTPTDTESAQQRHKKESIDKIDISIGGGAPAASVQSVTDWDLAYAEKFLTIIKDPEPKHAAVGFAHTVVLWRIRGYDLVWALSIAAEITASGKKYSIRYFSSAVARQQDERAREIAREVNGKITPACPTNGNGHAAGTSRAGSVIAAADKQLERIRALTGSSGVRHGAVALPVRTISSGGS